MIKLIHITLWSVFFISSPYWTPWIFAMVMLTGSWLFKGLMEIWRGEMSLIRQSYPRFWLPCLRELIYETQRFVSWVLSDAYILALVILSSRPVSMVLQSSHHLCEGDMEASHQGPLMFKFQQPWFVFCESLVAFVSCVCGWLVRASRIGWSWSLQKLFTEASLTRY